VKLADYERWRQALEEGGQAAIATSRRIRSLERELARKEKALAEAAALLVLKKKWRVSMGRTRTTARTRRASRDLDRDYASSGRWCSPCAGVPHSGDLSQEYRALAA
jgi:hypothetical protein